MFAYIYTKYGPPDVLQKVALPRPAPTENEVLVKVFATTVSSADWRLRSLTMPKGLAWAGRLGVGIQGPRKPVLGTEFSGEVAAIGTSVSRFAVGDEVIGFPGTDLGAHATFIVMPETGKLVLKPASMSHEIAAAIPFGGTTAYDFLVNKGKLRAGERVLINGASGSVGTACVQIARHLGADVTAVCRQKNADRVGALGANRVIDYGTTDFTKEDILYDVIVDTNGSAPWAHSKHALRKGGRMLLIAGHANDMIFGPIKARIAGKRLIGGVARENQDLLRAVVDLAANGTLRPVIDSHFTFDQMQDAHRRVDTGRKVGNVIVTVDA